MTMALWSAPRTRTTWKLLAPTPLTNAWSIRANRGDSDQGPQVASTLRFDSQATATAASVNWEAIRLYKGHAGVALKSPTKTQGELDRDAR